MRNKTLTLILLFVGLSLFSQRACSEDWSWNLDNTLMTFSATENATSQSVSGPFVRLDTGFLEMTIENAVGAEVPAVGSKIYPVEVPGFFLSVPPVLTSEKQMTMSVSAGTCPSTSTVYNWVFAGWNNQSNMTSHEQGAMGKLTWDAPNQVASITNIYNVTNYNSPSWLNFVLNLNTSPCVNGLSTVIGPVNTDRRGEMYLSQSGGMIYRTDANNLVLGLPEQTISSVASLSGLYAGYLFRYNQSGTVAENIKPFRVFLGKSGTSRSDALDDVKNTQRDSSFGEIRFDVGSINVPSAGFLTATFERGNNTVQFGCTSYTNATPQTMIVCAGQKDDNAAKPANLVLVEVPVLPSVGSPICSSGSSNGTCVVTGNQTLPDGAFATLNNLTVSSGSTLTIPGMAGIEALGEVLIEGTVEGDIKELIAEHLHITSTGRMNSNLNARVKNFTLESGGVIEASGRGGAGGTGGGNGAGLAGGLGHNDINGGGAGSGANHGSLGGVGENSLANPTTYGNLEVPVELGSGGGSGEGGNAGGDGGGRVRLIVSQNAVIDGEIRASGLDGANGSNLTGSDGGGGGSGGSIRIRTDSLAGAGKLYARGGRGGQDGTTGSNCGGGGGWRTYFGQIHLNVGSRVIGSC